MTRKEGAMINAMIEILDHPAAAGIAFIDIPAAYSTRTRCALHEALTAHGFNLARVETESAHYTRTGDTAPADAISEYLHQ